MKKAPKSIHHTVINAPIETFWATLVATDTPLPFFFGAVCDTEDGLRPGAGMRMLHPNGKIAMVVGEVLEFDPPHRYSHTFQMTNLDDGPCKVTYELTESPEGTVFALIIEDAIEGSKLHKQMISSQGFIASNLKAMAETGRPAFSGRMVGLLSPIMAAFAKPSQRVENWPLSS